MVLAWSGHGDYGIEALGEGVGLGDAAADDVDHRRRMST